jgi:hypothetical protein
MIVQVFLLHMFQVPLATAGSAPAISAITVSTISPGTAVFSWHTDIPSTSQVVFVDGDLAPVSASGKDTTPVIMHTVQTQVIPGTTYTYYVVSEAQGTSTSSANKTRPPVFSVPPVNAGAPEDYRLDLTGANAVYEGYDLYIGINAVLLGGQTAHLTFDAPDGLPPGATFHVICAYNTNISNEHADSFWDSLGRQWCWNGNNDSSIVRVRTSPTTPLGQYSLAIHTTAGGIKRNTVVAFTVLGAPQPPVRRVAQVSPIPAPAIRLPVRRPVAPVQVATWQQNMTSLGRQWCNPGETMSFGYEQQIWYYDGSRTYFQLSDYTGSPSQWIPCAVNIVNQYRDYVLKNNGAVPGWRVFPHGLAMNYWRTGDTGSRDAVMALANKSAFAWSSGGVNVSLIRETAYLIEALTLAERLGAVHDPRLDRAVAFGIGHFNQLCSPGNSLASQPFYDGLMAEALIEYYEFSHDPRIPDTIRQMLDWIWTYAWNPVTDQMVYNTLAVPASYTNDLNNLIAPAYAWYWALTGDQNYQQRGDQLFAAALALDISYSGKIFNQNYRWTFDYVNWRTTGVASPSAFLAGSNATQPSDIPKILALTMDQSVTGGGSIAAEITLTAIPTQSTQVALSLSPAGPSMVLMPPTSMSVPSGSQAVKFKIPAADVSQLTSATVVASLDGGTAQATTIVVPSTWGKCDIRDIYTGASFTKGVGEIILYLTVVAPVGGIPVTLSSSNPAVFQLPASVVIPAGVVQYSVPVRIGAVSAATSVTVQGKVINTITRSTQVLPPHP